jgi:surface polysaccharide O-acyltransferase-like enzyme
MRDQTRESGLDLIKAVCIVLVVIWHLQPIRAEMLPDACAAAFWGKQAIGFFYQNLSLLAVPSFVLISLYLFISKLSRSGDYWKKRFLRLFQIYVFWVGIQFILYLLLGGELPLPLKTILRSGGPDLPLTPAIPSIFYYLFILMVSTLLALIFFKLPDKLKPVVSLVVIFGSIVYFLVTPLIGRGVDTRSMLGYYIYIPVAYYLYRYKDQFVRYRWVFLTGFILSVVYEWAFSGMTSAYARLPVFFGVLFFVSMFISSRAGTNPATRFLSIYSLGIFALHPYWMAALMIVSGAFLFPDGVLAAGGVPAGVSLFVATFILTCLSAYGLGKTKFRVYVS